MPALATVDQPTVGLADRARFDTLHRTVPIAFVTFEFDPFAHVFGDLVVRWGTIALVAVLIAALVLAGIQARGAGLQWGDVPFIVVGIVPGAIVGGRFGYALLHIDYYARTPDRLLDPSLGGLELGLGVVGGVLTGVYLARLLGTAAGRWLHVATAPVLLSLGVGKLTLVLTGSGQGVPSDAVWATAYVGPGPWGSLAPALPSIPSQAFEGIAILLVLVGLTVAVGLGAFGRRDGRLFFVGIGLWALARAAVSTTWRDPIVAAGLQVGGLIALGIAAGCLALLVYLTVRRRRPTSASDAPGEVSWPDPMARPRF